VPEVTAGHHLAQKPGSERMCWDRIFFNARYTASGLRSKSVLWCLYSPPCLAPSWAPWVDGSVLWLAGVLDSIPFYLFVAAVAFALQGKPWAMHVAMVATFWTGTGRLVRAEVMKIKSREFILSARAIGLPDRVILTRHVLPNTGHILLIQASIVFVAAIKTEVILSFLGLGVQDGVSWGLMLAESTQEVLAGHFNNFIAASAMLFVLLMGFNQLSDALQDAFDPREAAL
jgi:ABC-type dipeptide/oligopeptide/nickel transport system permease subunit